MFDIVGEAAVQQIPRAGISASGTEKDAGVRKAEQLRQARPVENSKAGEKPQSEVGADEKTKTRNRLEDGKIIVEKYDEDGRLVRRTPPGYLPFGEIV
jgi:hypothetical protein